MRGESFPFFVSEFNHLFPDHFLQPCILFFLGGGGVGNTSTLFDNFFQVQHTLYNFLSAFKLLSGNWVEGVAFFGVFFSV